MKYENILDLSSILPAKCLPDSQHHAFKTTFYRHQFSEYPGTDQANITLYATCSPVSLWNILCFQDSLEQSSIHWSSRKETWVLVPTWCHCPRWASHACHAQIPRNFQWIEGMWREREGNFLLVKSWHFMEWSVQPVTWSEGLLRNLSQKEISWGIEWITSLLALQVLCTQKLDIWKSLFPKDAWSK